MPYELIMLPVSRPSEEELERNPASGDRYVAIRTHNKALLERYMPEFTAFFKELMEAFGDIQADPMRFIIPDGDLEFVESNLDEAKKLVEVGQV